VVGNVGVAGRAEQDRVVIADLLAAVLGHHAPVFLVILAAPAEVIELEGESPFALGQRPQDFDSGVDDFRTDAVAGNGCDLVGLHGLLLG
jgi:hypothetical protein